MKKDLLTKAFPHELIRQRQGQGGKTLSYVETHSVIARLNEASDFEWSFEIVRHEILADEVIVLGKLTIDGVTKMAFGGSSVTRDSSNKEVSLADDLKAGASDAIKKCASLFGIGLEMYGGAAARDEERPEPPARPAPPQRIEERLTSRQLGAIQSSARRRGLQANDLAELLHGKSGKREVHLLTRKEASAVLDELTATNGTQR